MTESNTPEPESTLPTPRKRRNLLSGMLDSIQQAGRDVVSVALGRLLDSPEAEPDATADPPEVEEAEKVEDAHRRVGMLHTMAEQLRGAADSFVAAKLDEIEARVDEKLDRIEQRIDQKIVELHEQLAEMRDRELRHRLRLLKITLVFTVLVAALSLLYKWFGKLL